MEELNRNVKIMGVGAAILCFFLTIFYDKAIYGIKESNPFFVITEVFKHGFTFYMLILLLVACCVGIYAYYSRKSDSILNADPLGRKFKALKGKQPYGDAHFEQPHEYEDVASVEMPEVAEGPIFGQLDESGRKIIVRYPSVQGMNNNVAVIGAAGSGKTANKTKNDIIQFVRRGESAIITDPDGGICREWADYFKDNGYVVRILNFQKLNLSDGWNAMKSLEGNNLEINAQKFASTIIANIVSDMSSIYATGPLALLKALILKVMLCPEFPEEERNLGTVYKLLLNPGGEAFFDSLFDRNILTKAEMPCLEPYMSFKQASPNLRGNLITNLASQLQLLQNQAVKDILTYDDIDLELPGKRPCVYFLIFPDTYGSFSFLTSLFFTMILTKLVDLADSNKDGKLEVPVNFLLDEFPSIGIIPDFERYMATVRRRNINITVIIQDIVQLRKNYGDSAYTILGNCSTWFIPGVNDSETAKYLIDKIGEVSIEVETKQYDSGGGNLDIGKKISYGQGKRKLLTLDEIMRIPKNQCLIMFQGHNPILAYKYPYYLRHEAKNLRKLDWSDFPELTDREAKDARKKKELV